MINEIRGKNEPLIVLVGNKNDLPKKVDNKLMEKLINKYGGIHFQVAANSITPNLKQFFNAIFAMTTEKKYGKL